MNHNGHHADADAAARENAGGFVRACPACGASRWRSSRGVAWSLGLFTTTAAAAWCAVTEPSARAAVLAAYPVALAVLALVQPAHACDRCGFTYRSARPPVSADPIRPNPWARAALAVVIAAVCAGIALVSYSALRTGW